MFGKFKHNRNFMTNKYKEIFKRHMSKILFANGQYNFDLFEKYTNAFSEMEKKVLLNERNQIRTSSISIS